jgi:phenylacetate-CoA ligase
MAQPHYDRLETRDPDERERELCGRLPDLLALALSAPGWAQHLAGVEPNAVTSRAALAKLPVMRKSEFAARQKEHPPFGGLNVTAPGKARRLLMSPGPVFEPEGDGRDYWGAARALFATGMRAGDILHNAFIRCTPISALMKY